MTVSGLPLAARGKGGLRRLESLGGPEVRRAEAEAEAEHDSSRRCGQGNSAVGKAERKLFFKKRQKKRQGEREKQNRSCYVRECPCQDIERERERDRGRKKYVRVGKASSASLVFVKERLLGHI